MKKIAFWAKSHRWPARTLIITSFLVLNVLGYFAGRNLNELGIRLPSFFLILLITIFAIPFLMYPGRNTQQPGTQRNRSFRFRKTLDLTLATTGFLMMVFVANRPGSLSFFISRGYAVSTSHPGPGDSTFHLYKSPQAFAASLKNAQGERLAKKERRTLLKAQIRNIKKSDELSQSAKAGLIALSILIAAGLLYLVASLSCSLSCSGYDGLAVLTALGGTTLVVVLLLAVIRGINRKNKKKKAEPVPAGNGTGS